MPTSYAIQLFLHSRKAKRLSPATIKWYRGIFSKFESQYPELPVAPEPIYDFLESCPAGDERCHGYYRALRALYNFIKKRLRNFPNPMHFVESPIRSHKEPKPLWPDELSKLFAQRAPPQIKAALLFLADSGARLGELHNLQLKDLQETPWGYVASVTGKTGQRMVPISYETYHALMITLPLPWSKDWLGRKISQAFRNAGLTGGAHRLRHTFGTYWEGDELMLQTIMGHTNISTTKRYRALRLRLMLEQHRLYSPLKIILSGQLNML